MSRPFEAKGVGACLKHVLNTRLPPVLPRSDERGSYAGRIADILCATGPSYYSYPHVRLMRRVVDALRKLDTPRLGDDDPLPPEDRLASVVALDTLYQSHASKLFRLFARRVDRQDAGDLTHDSFVRFADVTANSDTRIDRPEAYLSQIATNLLRNRAKSALERSRARSTPIDDVTLAGPDQVAALEARDMLNRLQTALQRLPIKTRDIFLAHRVEGLSYSAIATQQGLGIKGVEWHMRKAIAHLDRTLRAR